MSMYGSYRPADYLARPGDLLSGIGNAIMQLPAAQRQDTMWARQDEQHQRDENQRAAQMSTMSEMHRDIYGTVSAMSAEIGTNFRPPMEGESIEDYAKYADSVLTQAIESYQGEEREKMYQRALSAGQRWRLANTHSALEDATIRHAGRADGGTPIPQTSTSATTMPTASASAPQTPLGSVETMAHPPTAPVIESVFSKWGERPQVPIPVSTTSTETSPSASRPPLHGGELTATATSNSTAAQQPLQGALPVFNTGGGTPIGGVNNRFVSAVPDHHRSRIEAFIADGESRLADVNGQLAALRSHGVTGGTRYKALNEERREIMKDIERWGGSLDTAAKVEKPEKTVDEEERQARLDLLRAQAQRARRAPTPPRERSNTEQSYVPNFHQTKTLINTDENQLRTLGGEVRQLQKQLSSAKGRTERENIRSQLDNKENELSNARRSFDNNQRLLLNYYDAITTSGRNPSFVKEQESYIKLHVDKIALEMLNDAFDRGALRGDIAGINGRPDLAKMSANDHDVIRRWATEQNYTPAQVEMIIDALRRRTITPTSTGQPQRGTTPPLTGHPATAGNLTGAAQGSMF